MAQVSMKDIAEALDLNQSTVSRALRGESCIPAATKKRVKAKAQELGYRPNPLVSALVASRRRRVPDHFQAKLAFVSLRSPTVQVDSTSYEGQLLFAAKERAAEHGYLVEEFPMGGCNYSAAQIKRIFIARGLCGGFFATFAEDHAPLDFPWDDFPAVAIGLGFRGPRIYRVAINIYRSMQIALENCERLGYRRIGFVMPVKENRQFDGHEIGSYMAWQFNFPREERMEPLAVDQFDRKAFLQWFEENKPQVIISSLVKKLLACLQDNGIQVPEDVGLVGLSNEYSEGFARVKRPHDRMAALGVDVLVDRIHTNKTGIPAHAGEYFINPQWEPGPTVLDQNPRPSLPVSRTASD